MTHLQKFIIFACSLFFFSGISSAQDILPDPPPPVQTLVTEGAQIRYLGRTNGYDSWITIKNGREQYFHARPGDEVFMMGTMFDKTGKAVTIQQVRNLQQKEGDTLDSLASEAPQETEQTKAFKSPAEQLFFDIENSNWVPLGQPGAPVLYAFIDPQCPHCHAFIADLRESFLDTGRMQLRMIPVGFREETRAQAAFLLATPKPQERWYRHMDGDETALPAKAEINQQGIARNVAIMQSWDFNVTPMLVYRARNGSIKILRGQPKDLPGLIADIGDRG